MLMYIGLRIIKFEKSKAETVLDIIFRMFNSRLHGGCPSYHTA